MADQIEYTLHGDDLQIVEVMLKPGEAARGEVGTMMYMDEGINMQTTTGGGIFKGLKRMVSGEGFFISAFKNTSDAVQKVGFGASYPGKVIPINLKDEEGGSFLCQKDAFLCAAADVEIKVAFTKRFGSGLFGGEGFILQRLKGDGMAFIHAGGTCIKRTLAEGEKLRVDSGCLVGLSESVEYGIKFVGGFKNALFGGEGLFLAEVEGPGTVYLQSLPFSRLVDRIVAASDFSTDDEG
jgi:uncharacterized protein (TIGR00266 family)